MNETQLKELDAIGRNYGLTFSTNSGPAKEYDLSVCLANMKMSQHTSRSADRLTHIIDRKKRRRHTGQRLHLHTGPAFCLDLAEHLAWMILACLSTT